jgi:hypothetical protein
VGSEEEQRRRQGECTPSGRGNEAKESARLRVSANHESQRAFNGGGGGGSWGEESGVPKKMRQATGRRGAAGKVK